jgi:hypothetical protein
MSERRDNETMVFTTISFGFVPESAGRSVGEPAPGEKAARAYNAYSEPE